MTSLCEDFDEKQYWPSKWSKRLSADVICEEHIKLTERETKKNKETILSEENLQYGKSPSEIMDVYGKDLPSSAPWFVYIHGGYWVEFSKNSSGFCARPLWKSGIRVSVPEYDLAPKVTMTEIVEQIYAMAEYVLQRAESEGSSGVWICGHSAGAQLAARLLDETWLSKLNEVRKNLFKGVLLIGGVYDLSPVLKLKEVNDLLKMNENEAEKHSPTNTIVDFKGKSLVRSDFKTLIIVAENESEAFKQQSIHYHKLLNAKNAGAEYIFMPELDHFDIVENLREDDYELTKRIITEIKSSAVRPNSTPTEMKY